MQNPDEAIEHYQLAKKDRTMNSEAEKLFDAISDWKSNDDWQFADKEAAWKFFFQAGAASRDAEVSALEFSWAGCSQQLKDACADLEEVEQECDQLRAELVKALAACKVKDEALASCGFTNDSTDSEMCGSYYDAELVQRALAIKPDDAALKAWIGEPVSFLYKHNSGFGDGHFWTHRPTHNGVTALETKALYSPKELK